MINSTLVFLRKDNQILLGMKKRAFGKGKWNGIGGKPEHDESIMDTAHRELEEEIGVHARSLDLVAQIQFVYTGMHDWDQIVSIYFCANWDGDPRESDEMMPKWFSLPEIPYDQMWPDDAYWLPKVLNGEKVRALFVFDKNLSIFSYQIDELK